MPDIVDKTLKKLAALIAAGRFENLEDDGLEIKPTPSTTSSWRQSHTSANAFLNTRGGLLLFGFKEEGQGPQRRWVFTGYREDAEAQLKEFPRRFTDQNGTPLDLSQFFPPPQIRDFQEGRAAVLYVDELPADRKFVFYDGQAWKRVLTGDHKLTEADIARQEEYKEQVRDAREVQPVPGATLADLDLDALNDYIQQLNSLGKVETIKADLEAARGFLARKLFIKDETVTTLGMLVCGQHAGDQLGFRCHVHGYVDAPQEVARDKQDLIDNILPLMEKSLAYVLRNIQIGISIAEGGTAVPQYPEEVLRETVNNALAHRDYSVNKQVIISIKPGRHVSIRNPGSFRPHLLIEHPGDPIPLRRIIPEARARNPKLADVLRVYRKWEGRGIGMATLVNLCLENQIDLPTYRVHSEEVTLFLNAGPLVGKRMETRLASFDAYIAGKLGGPLSARQTRVLSYLIKAEWANEKHHYTILLTPDNNHFEQLVVLERAGLICQHERSTPAQPVFVADRVLMQTDYRPELEALFGDISGLDSLSRRCLDVMWRCEKFASRKAMAEPEIFLALWHERGAVRDADEFAGHVRQVSDAIAKLEEEEFIVPDSDRSGFILNRSKDRLE